MGFEGRGSALDGEMLCLVGDNAGLVLEGHALESSSCFRTEGDSLFLGLRELEGFMRVSWPAECPVTPLSSGAGCEVDGSRDITGYTRYEAL